MNRILREGLGGWQIETYLGQIARWGGHGRPHLAGQAPKGKKKLVLVFDREAKMTG